MKTNPTAQAYDELQKAFDHYNTELFDGSLPQCLITMQRDKRCYGYFSSQRFANRNEKSVTDEIAINPCYFGVVPLQEILQTLVHEMSHAWQFHHGKPGRRGYHNKEWADKLETIGLMPSDTGKPGGKRTGEKMADYAIEGGAFLKATASLLATGFEITWLDRYPPRTIQEVAESMYGETLTQAVGIEELEGIASLLILPEGNKSNRHKYRCPVCEAQVWGKPNLRLLCGNTECEAAPFDVMN